MSRFVDGWLSVDASLRYEKQVPFEEGGYVILTTPNTDAFSSTSKTPLKVREIEPRKGDTSPEKVIILTGKDYWRYRHSQALMDYAGLGAEYAQGFFYRNHPNADVIEIEKKA